MPPALRKRKAPPPTEEQPPKKKPSKTIAKRKENAPSSPASGTENVHHKTDTESAVTLEPRNFTVQDDKGKPIPCQAWNWDTTSSSASKARADGKTTLIFTHGAGGGLENPATKLFAEGWASIHNAPVITFQGTMNLASRVKAFESVLSHVRRQHGQPAQPIAVGGRSMGARAAVTLALQHDDVQKVVAASYPLTAPSGQVRDQILLDLPAGKEVLFISGDGDSMCDLQDLRKVMAKMKATTKLVVVEGADHGMSLSLAGLGLGKKEKEDVVERIRIEGGRSARAWAAGEAVGGRMKYDGTENRVVTGDEDEEDGTEVAHTEEDDERVDRKATSEENGEKRPGGESGQRGRSGGTKRAGKIAGGQNGVGTKKKDEAASKIKETAAKKKKNRAR